MNVKQTFQINKFLFYGFELRKSGNSWAVDQKKHGVWDFIAKGNKKECINLIENKITELQKTKV